MTGSRAREHQDYGAAVSDTPALDPGRRGVGDRPAPRWRLVFAGVWLVYLSEPLGEILDEDGWRRVAGLAALAGFAGLYLLTLMRAQLSMPGENGSSSLIERWACLLGLLALIALLVPMASYHALTGVVFVGAAAMTALPNRQAWALLLVLFAGTEALANLVPGWQDNGYGLAVVLAGLAVWGLRMNVLRTRELIAAEQEVSRLAVQQERSRIASDLHDILGHSLTVITVKAELAGRLLDVDIDRARVEVAELESLSRDALADVRATALGVRGVSLPGEIAAARDALEAAGISADLPTAADQVPTRWRELFAWTVREGVTNVLRHSAAVSCTVRISPTAVEVVDDGRGTGDSTDGTTDPPGLGLAGLRRRAEAAGARLESGGRPDGPGFRLRVELPA